MSAHVHAPLKWREYQLPKRGSLQSEFDDASGGDPIAARFAVADGATETVCADVWAKLLVDGYLAHPVADFDEWHDWLTILRHKWWDDVGQRQLPWYAENKLDEGAAATLVGLTIDRDANWHALAVGDACLFQVRGHELIKAFPITHSKDFGIRPQLVGSLPRATDPRPLQTGGDWRVGDQILLMTDALAEWFLQEHEQLHNGAPTLERVLDLKDTPERQAAEIDALRDTRRLRNDDVTFLCIEL